MIEYPLISIVTVVYNNVSNIEETIQNISSLTYPKIEYIIIDGNSTDGTIDVIKKYTSKIDVFITEKDLGIYDAMNKAIKYCNGDWVIYMNSGDRFYDYNIFNFFLDNNDFKGKNILFGSTSFVRNNQLYIIPPKNLKYIWRGMPMCHQSMFIRTSLLKKNPFNLNYTFASDYNFLYDIFLLDEKSVEKLNMPISIIRTKGFSETNSIKTYMEYSEISISKNSYKTFIYIYFLYKITERRAAFYLKKLLDIN